jgi:hypothetical protein
VEAVRGVEGFVADFFLCGDGGVELAGGDLFGGGVDVAELAGGEVVFGGAHGWAEGAAEDGAMLVEIAGAVVEVEHRAGLVVGELFEENGGFAVFVEDASVQIAGEPGVEAGEGVGYSCVDARGFFGVGLFEESEAFAETGGVFVRDGEDADAALGAAGFADEMRAAACGGGGEGGVYDLDERITHEELPQIPPLRYGMTNKMELLGGVFEYAAKDGVHVGQLAVVVEGAGQLFRREASRDLGDFGYFIAEDEVVLP